jgi:hypothetical protein
LQKLPAVKDFTLVPSVDDAEEYEIDPYGYEGEWTEERKDDWRDVALEWEVVETQNGEEACHAAKAERFLCGLEECTLAEIANNPYNRDFGLLR